MKTTTALILFGTAVLATAPGALAAQQDTPEESAKIGCFRGQPLPRCRSFWIVEMQGSTPLAQTRRSVSFDQGRSYPHEAYESVLEWNLGHMLNVSPRWALGGELTVGTGNGDPLTGIKGRARRWLNSDLSLELEGGVLRSDASGSRFQGTMGPTAALRINVRDQGAFYVRWDALDIPEQENPVTGYHDPGGVHHGLSVGAAAGSLPALIGTGTLGILYAVLIGAYVSTSS